MTRLLKTSVFIFTITALSLLVFPVAAQISPYGAASGCNLLGIRCGTGNGSGDLILYIRNIVNGLLSLMAIVAAIYLILAGIKYVTSAGDEKKADEAKHTILYAIIGLIVIGLSMVLVNFIIFIIPK
jgi:hypothetical protein